MSGVTVTQGDYSTYANKTKGNVKVTSNGIVIKPAEGRNEFDDNAKTVIGHYILKFEFSKVLDITGYKGIRVMTDQSGGFGFVVTLNDNTGKTHVTLGYDTPDLAFWAETPKDGSSTTAEGLFTTDMGSGGTWAMKLSDFTYKIKGMNFDCGVENPPISTYSDLKTGTFTHIEFF